MTTVTPPTPPAATAPPAEPSEAASGAENGSEPVAQQGIGNGQAPETEERDESGKFLSHEAMKYRRRLRDTEQERDELRERLDRIQTAEVERLASAAGLAVASDVWLHGATVDTLRGEDGSIDDETVTGLVADILHDRPGLQAVPIGDVGIGRGASASGRRHDVTPGLSNSSSRVSDE